MQVTNAAAVHPSVPGDEHMPTLAVEGHVTVFR